MYKFYEAKKHVKKMKKNISLYISIPRRIHKQNAKQFFPVHLLHPYQHQRLVQLSSPV
jgi:hypothetical protein